MPRRFTETPYKIGARGRTLPTDPIVTDADLRDLSKVAATNA